MKEGLLWFDDSGRDLSDKVMQAARRYRKKFGTNPNACFVHPSIIKDEKKLEFDGIQVLALPSVLRHHFWLGVES